MNFFTKNLLFVLSFALMCPPSQSGVTRNRGGYSSICSGCYNNPNKFCVFCDFELLMLGLGAASFYFYFEQSFKAIKHVSHKLPCPKIGQPALICAPLIQSLLTDYCILKHRSDFKKRLYTDPAILNAIFQEIGWLLALRMSSSRKYSNNRNSQSIDAVTSSTEQKLGALAMLALTSNVAGLKRLWRDSQKNGLDKAIKDRITEENITAALARLLPQASVVLSIPSKKSL